jgi:hypothetical protein
MKHEIWGFSKSSNVTKIKKFLTESDRSTRTSPMLADMKKITIFQPLTKSSHTSNAKAFLCQ